MPYILAANALDNIVGRGAKQLGNDGELVHVVLAWEQRLALQHLGKNAARAPDVNLDVVLLPCKHDFRGAVVSSRDVARHLGILYTRKTEVADLEIAVFVDQDVAGFQIAVNDTSRVDILQTTLPKSV